MTARCGLYPSTLRLEAICSMLGNFTIQYFLLEFNIADNFPSNILLCRHLSLKVYQIWRILQAIPPDHFN